MTLLVVFGAAAGLLAALGVYGLFSWSVALRTRELAIRLTLGERPVSVGMRVIRQSLVLIAAGLSPDSAIIRLAETALTRVLFEMSPRDPASLAAACALLVVVALVACVPPALRALRVDPVDGLRASRRARLAAGAGPPAARPVVSVGDPRRGRAPSRAAPASPAASRSPCVRVPLTGVSPGVAATSHAGSSCWKSGRLSFLNGASGFSPISSLSLSDISTSRAAR